jgi:hypothetical protein
MTTQIIDFVTNKVTIFFGLSKHVLKQFDFGDYVNYSENITDRNVLMFYPETEFELDELCELIPKLITVHRNIIVFTTSPYVVSSIKDCDVIAIDKDGTLTRIHDVYGKSVNHVFWKTHTFPDRIPQISEQFDEIIYLIADNNLEEAQISIDRLRESIGHDDELSSLESRIKTRKLLNGN